MAYLSKSEVERLKGAPIAARLLYIFGMRALATGQALRTTEDNLAREISRYYQPNGSLSRDAILSKLNEMKLAGDLADADIGVISKLLGV